MNIFGDREILFFNLLEEQLSTAKNLFYTKIENNISRYISV